jgi:xanthine dehydrogenase accessory factor
VENVEARLAADTAQAKTILDEGCIAVFADSTGHCCKAMQPAVLIDAILAKQNLGTTIADAPVVIALGPGFTAGQDCHAVVETMRGHTLGRVYYEGGALPNTGIPGSIGDFTIQRVLRAPADGVFQAKKQIGDTVERGELIARVDETAILAPIAGVLRGLLSDGITVQQGLKCGDIDPRCEVSHCYQVSDKALAIAGGVLEAILHLTGGTHHGI